ncbi:ribonuclease HII [Rhizobium mongolense]|uniref:Ribonuclease HII n=1 Tax=Rhizobium gallicum TaxID=56730 RepID=A0A1L5NFI4_9HYPH|nr:MULTISPECIES: ribonuclease HII [Rhizobium]APO66619.1 ribonuclease HII [Rhizobium gallicum]QPB20457.1 ribonuclease HII [Rhizobium sp. 007]WFU88034.1 ribonuclease HII [Rhizobium sp. CC1099]
MKPRTSPDSPLLFEEVPLVPDFKLELKARKAGHWPVAGADEAGRGPLAGPVVAAAVILDPRRIPDGLNDSKQLSAQRREQLFAQILATATVSIASSSSTHIDLTDIRKASLDAMRRAICGLAIPASYVLTDGLDVPPGLECPGQAVVKGDSRSVSIAAASIVAKVTRDRMMARADAVFPDYGFAAHVGYGTAQHRARIERHGPCSLHRMSFRPLKKNGTEGATMDEMLEE